MYHSIAGFIVLFGATLVGADDANAAFHPAAFDVCGLKCEFTVPAVVPRSGQYHFFVTLKNPTGSPVKFSYPKHLTGCLTVWTLDGAPVAMRKEAPQHSSWESVVVAAAGSADIEMSSDIVRQYDLRDDKVIMQLTYHVPHDPANLTDEERAQAVATDDQPSMWTAPIVVSVERPGN